MVDQGRFDGRDDLRKMCGRCHRSIRSEGEEPYAKDSRRTPSEKSKKFKIGLMVKDLQKDY